MISTTGAVFVLLPTAHEAQLQIINAHKYRRNGKCLRGCQRELFAMQRLGPRAAQSAAWCVADPDQSTRHAASCNAQGSTAKSRKGRHSSDNPTENVALLATACVGCCTCCSGIDH